MKKYNRVWLCEKCNVVFTVHVAIPYRKKVFCPNCGDLDDTRLYESDRKSPNSKTKVRWKPAELAVLQEVIDGKKFPIQAALELGRTPNSVMKKVSRMKREMES